MIRWTVTEYSQTSPILGNGLSAYEVAVKNGYVGTEAQWLITLTGQLVTDFGFVATQDTSGHKILLSTGAYADCATLNQADAIIGITTNAALTGDILTIRPSGNMTEPSWNWDITMNIYLGELGALTQTMPTTGVIIEIAKPVTPTEILIGIRPPIVI